MPDYSTYSLEELYDARAWVDTEKYPDRAAAIAAEISSRQPVHEGLETQQLSPRHPSHLRLTRPIIAMYLVICGAIGLAVMLDSGIAEGGLGPRLASFGLILLVFGGMVVSGFLIWKRSPLGYLLGAAAMLLQVPIAQGWLVTHMITTGPFLELKLWPRMGFALFLGATPRVKLLLHENHQPLYLGINLAAAVITWALAYYGLRYREIARRVAHSQDAG